MMNGTAAAAEAARAKTIAQLSKQLHAVQQRWEVERKAILEQWARNEATWKQERAGLQKERDLERRLRVEESAAIIEELSDVTQEKISLQEAVSSMAPVSSAASSSALPPHSPDLGRAATARRSSGSKPHRHRHVHKDHHHLDFLKEVAPRLQAVHNILTGLQQELFGGKHVAAVINGATSHTHTNSGTNAAAEVTKDSGGVTGAESAGAQSGKDEKKDRLQDAITALADICSSVHSRVIHSPSKMRISNSGCSGSSRRSSYTPQPSPRRATLPRTRRGSGPASMDESPSSSPRLMPEPGHSRSLQDSKNASVDTPFESPVG